MVKGKTEDFNQQTCAQHSLLVKIHHIFHNILSIIIPGPTNKLIIESLYFFNLATFCLREVFRGWLRRDLKKLRIEYLEPTNKDAVQKTGY